MKKTFKKRWIVLLASLLIILSAGLYYLFDTYPATSVEHSSNVSVSYDDNKILVLKPIDVDQTQVGIIFYQGGKVDEKAYIELFAPLVEKGITIYIPAMPFELAVLNFNKAEKVLSNYSHDEWYVGGHSLGGSMIASFTSKHTKDISGLFLLAAYSTTDLSAYEGKVVSVYGDQDKVLNMKSFDKNMPNLPESTTVEVIEGANHAQFGSYGFQKGDGQASITKDEQQEIVRELLLKMIEN